MKRCESLMRSVAVGLVLWAAAGSAQEIKTYCE